MAKRKRKTSARSTWKQSVLSPVLQQIVALLVIAFGLVTLLALFGVTPGRWTDAIVRLLRRMMGWGAYPVAVSTTLAGLLWLQYHLDRPVLWRWRPFVGAEVVFLSLLPLTHFIVSKGDLWEQVETGLGGGLVGWALATLLSTYLGVPAAVVGLAGFLAVGLALAFDVTVADVKRVVSSVESPREAQIGGATRAKSSRQQPQTRQQRRAKGSPSRSAQSQSAHSARSRQAVQSTERVSARQSLSTQWPVSRDAMTGEPVRAAVVPLSNVSTDRSGSLTYSGEEELEEAIEYVLPSLDILTEPGQPAMSDEEIREKSRTIENTLAQFGLPVEVSEARVGPTVTQFGIKPGFLERGGTTGRKVRVNQISALADDLALALAAPRLRVEAPVPGRAIVGIEVPNSQIQIVGIREVMDTDEFDKLDAPLAFAVGRDVTGAPVVADLAKMPHLLIAGTTGSGKSVCIKAITVCLIANNTPDELRLIMIDPKMVELVRFNGLPHLLGRVEVDLERVVKVLRWVALEMDSRYRRFAEATARNLDDYNSLMREQGAPTLPRIVVLIDELADLMMMAPDEVEKLICRIAQMARATGIHLVLATQRPSVDVVTGLIKANFPARISFATVSQTDSRVILDMQGAETLLGKGDMLYMASDAGHPIRVQGCFVSEDELEDLVQFWRDQVGPIKQSAPWERMISGPYSDDSGGGDDGLDDLLADAIALVQKSGNASASLLQRRLHIGHPRAARLMEEMEDRGVIGPPEAAGRRRGVVIGSKD